MKATIDDVLAFTFFILCLAAIIWLGCAALWVVS
jgi:hypothetical protein